MLATFFKKDIFPILSSPYFGVMPMLCRLNGRLHHFSIRCSQNVSLKPGFMGIQEH